MTKTTTTKPDVMAQGDALQAERAAVALAAARAGLVDVMPAFDALEPAFERVKPLAADFARWRQAYGRDWVRQEPGINFTRLDKWLEDGATLITQFPGVVARARELYATMTVEGSAYAEREIRTRLGMASGIQAVEEIHRGLQGFVKEIDETIARRMANGTLLPRRLAAWPRPRVRRRPVGRDAP